MLLISNDHDAASARRLIALHVSDRVKATCIVKFGRQSGDFGLAAFLPDQVAMDDVPHLRSFGKWSRYHGPTYLSP